MKTLKNKIFWFPNFTLSDTSYLKINRVINVTFINDGYTYNQIKLVYVDDLMGDAIYFDDVYVGYKSAVSGNKEHYAMTKCTGKIHIIGGEDVENPDVIDFFKTISNNKYHNAPNTSFDSLDNKEIHFNSNLIDTQLINNLIGEEFYGVFKGKIIYTLQHISEETFTANYIKFENDRIRFWNDNTDSLYRVIYYSFSDKIWYANEAGGELKEVIFEEFKYTGLEDNKEFMEWLSKNAKITGRKNKDKKILYLRNFIIKQTSDAHEHNFFSTNYATPSAFGIKVSGGSITIPGTDNTFEFDMITPYYDGFYMDAYCYVRTENQEGFPAQRGQYPVSIYFYSSNCNVSYDTVNLFKRFDNLTMRIGYLPSFTKDQDFIQGILGNFKVYPDNIQHAIIDFAGNFYNRDISLPVGERAFLSNISIILASDQDKILDVNFFHTFKKLTVYGPYEEFSFEIQLDNEHKIKCRRGDSNLLYCPSDNEELPIISATFRGWVMERLAGETDPNYSEDFIDWIYQTAEDVKFVKGTNTAEELLQEICDTVKFFRGAEKINAQDLPCHILLMTLE